MTQCTYILKLFLGLHLLSCAFYILFWMVHTLGNNNALTYSHNTYHALHLLNSKSMNWKFMDYTQYISAMIDHCKSDVMLLWNTCIWLQFLLNSMEGPWGYWSIIFVGTISFQIRSYCIIKLLNEFTIHVDNNICGLLSIW